MTSGHERWDACGFDGAAFDEASLLVALRSLAERRRRERAEARDALRARPEPGTWSAIEYAAQGCDLTRLHACGCRPWRNTQRLDIERTS